MDPIWYLCLWILSSICGYGSYLVFVLMDSIYYLWLWILSSISVIGTQLFHVVLLNVPGVTLILRNTKSYNYLSYISSKTARLCNDTLLSATVNMSETFL
jgi:hypothetical protein